MPIFDNWESRAPIRGHFLSWKLSLFYMSTSTQFCCFALQPCFLKAPPPTILPFGGSASQLQSSVPYGREGGTLSNITAQYCTALFFSVILMSAEPTQSSSQLNEHSITQG